jgi:hypothetical protein
LEELCFARNHENLLLVTVDLTPRILDYCRQKGLSATDLNGRLYLRAKNLLVDRQALPGRRFRYEHEPRNIFVGKSVRIIRSLLHDWDRTWIQSELVERTGASPALVSRIVRHLAREGLLKKEGRRFRVQGPDLLRAWVDADRLERRVRLERFSVLSGDPMELARALKDVAEFEGTKICFTQWIAGWIRHPYTEPVVVSAYVSRSLPEAILENLGLRQVKEAGNVWIFLPNDEGVFLETQTVDDLPLVTDAQIYLDLQKTGLRGPDQAEALRNWEGFCRP